jgi:hypothetical protein
MTLINVEFAQEALKLDSFKFIPAEKYPYSIIGFQLKNFYDQQRIKIKSKYHTKDIIHPLPTSDSTVACFRGIKILLREKYNPLIKQLVKFNTILSDRIDIDVYRNLLEEYGLSCSDCFSFLKKGVYPIDGKCLSEISNIDITLESLYEDAFNTKSVPAYQSFSSFIIFILCNETIFNNQ